MVYPYLTEGGIPPFTLVHTFANKEATKPENSQKHRTSGVPDFSKIIKTIKIMRDLIMEAVLGVVAMPGAGSDIENELTHTRYSFSWKAKIP